MPAARRVSLRWGAWTRLGGGGVRTFFATARARVPVSLPRRTGWRKSATCAFFRRGRLLTGGARGTYARPVRADEPSGSPALAFFVDPFALASAGNGYWDSRSTSTTWLEATMGLLDKLLGRGKKAAGDVTGDSSMRREGAAQERQGAAEARAEREST